MEVLKKVKKVDAPYFLLTRIEAKILANAGERTPASWNWAGALVFSALLAINFSVFAGVDRKSSTGGAESIAESMALQPENQLYDE